MPAARQGLLRFFVTMLAFTAAGGRLAAANDYVWRNVVIGGGGFVTGVMFHPRERGLSYARTDVGGAYRWDAAAARWIALTDWIPWQRANLAGIESMAVDPSDPARVLLAAGTYNHQDFGHAAILRSNDHGRTFVGANMPFGMGGNEAGRANGERLAADPNDGAVVFFGSRDDGLWRSADGGATFARVAEFPALATSTSARSSGRWSQAVGIVFVVIDPHSGSAGQPSRVIYAGISSREGGLFRSRDAGRTWHPLPGHPSGLRPTQAELGADGLLYVSFGDEPGPNTMTSGAVWKFDPTSDSWSDITPLAPTDDMRFGYGAVAVSPTQPGTVVAATFCKWKGGDEIFRSTDGGKTWQPLLRDATWDHSSAPWTRTMKPHWVGDVAIDPFDPDHVLFTTGYGIWATDNATAAGAGGSVRWRFENAGLEETVPLAFVSPAVGAPLISGLGDIDGFKHDDLTRSPLQLTAPPRFTSTTGLAAAALEPRTIVRVGDMRDRQAGEVRGAISRDGGETWTVFASEPPGDGGGGVSISADGTTIVWTPRRGVAHVSRDAGATWRRCRGVGEGIAVVADGAHEDSFYAYDQTNNRLLVSEDRAATFAPRGRTFPAIGPRPGGFLDGFTVEVASPFGRAEEVWVSIRGGGLFRSTNAGRTFSTIAGVTQAHSIGFGRAAPGGETPATFIAGVVRGVQGIFRSDDAGATWTRINDDSHQFGWVDHVTGDPRVFGRVYFGTSGRGIIVGEPR